MNPATESRVIAADAPAKFSYAIATALGSGYLKPGPGTWGSLVGLIVAMVSHPFSWFLVFDRALIFGTGKDAPLLSGPLGMLVLLVPSVAVWLLLAYLGVRTSGQVAAFTGSKDPQFVVIDETAGQLITLLGAPLHWKSLLAGFILFRAFDIVKPPPIRRLEHLPQGTGIVVDDVAAGLYALAVMQVLLHFGTLGR